MDKSYFASEFEISESDFAGLLQRMLGNSEYQFPLSIAEKEYRDALYGMTAAAQLEDLFIDALETYIRINEPTVIFHRAQLGKREWDYRINGLTISHKVMLKLGYIALIWDATLKMDVWNSKYPFLIDLGTCSKKVFMGISSSKSSGLELLTSGTKEKSQTLFLARWSLNGNIEVLDTDLPKFSESEFHSKSELFRNVWSVFAKYKNHAPCNELEFLLSTDEVRVGEKYDLSRENLLRPGFYLIPHDLLQNLPVEANNRAQLLVGKTVRKLLEGTRDRGLMVPTVSWIQYFLGEPTKELYVKQRSSYEEIVRKFSE